MKFKNNAEMIAGAQRGRAICEGAKAAGRDLTQTEYDEVLAISDGINEFKAKADRSQQLIKAMDGLGHDGDDGFGGYTAPSGTNLRFSGRKSFSKSAARIIDPATKALASSGATVAPVGLVPGEPLPLDRPTMGLLNALRSQVLTTPPTFDYLRQTTQTNNAAPVAPGETKPTSVYGLERIHDQLSVIAHLSEPVNKYWLSDLPALQTFIDSQMGYGLDLAVEDQALNGDGTGENMTGILETSGVQTQAFSIDGWETIRKGMTKLWTVGAGSPIAVLNPLDHEAMDLTRTTTDAFLAGGVGGVGQATPVAGNPLSAWGLPVVLSNALTPGTGLLMDPAAVTLFSDGQVSMEWNPFSGFDKNGLIARAEGRFGLAVTKPLNIVILDMAA